MGGTNSKQQKHPLAFTTNHQHQQSNNNNNQYYENDEEYEDECTSMTQSIPCFSIFCPPDHCNNNNGQNNGNSNYSNHSRRKRKNNKYNDPIGSPIDNDPNSMRQRRTVANGNGHNGRSNYYDGLEVENSRHDVDVDSIGSSNGRNGNHSHHMQQHYHQTLPKAIIHNGLDGERQFMQKYEMSEVLGVGSTSICHRCINKSTGQSYACKIIDKVQIEQRFAGMMDQFHSEIDALKILQHPNIIQLYDVYTTKSKIYIVMELMAGGELFDYVVAKGTLTEAEASVIVRMVTGAVVYMHECNIMHRDLKPENLLLTHKPKSIYDLEVKIIDFGLSKSTKNDPMAQSFLGTRGYLAPEMLQRRQYSREVDAWALGVIVFVLLCGCLPFDDDSSTIFTDEQIQSKFRLRFPRWARNLSPSAKDLLSKLLDVNPSTRYTAEEALRHPWICGTTAPKDSMLHSPGRINLTPGKKANPQNVAAANRTQMNEIIKNRARANSLTRNRARASSNPRSRQLVRKKSI